MTLIELLQSPWAIVPSSLEMIQAIYTRHLAGEPVDLDAIEARLGRPLANDQQEYVVREGGVAVLVLSGAISPKANLFTRVSGGSSAQVFAQQVDSLRGDTRVRSVVIDMDSPGGNVLGLPAATSALAQLAAEKPTVTVCTGQMCSGGYWIGSASNRVYISGLTDVLGSIGVGATHTYNPRASSGPQTTEVTAGRYKRIASESAPLSKDGRAYLQAQVDEIYRVFVDTVAANRRVSADQVLERMADGRVFIGQQALDAGLADGIATVDDIVEQLATDPTKFAKRGRAVFALGGLPAASEAAAEPTAITGEQPPATTITTTTEVHMTPTEAAAKFAAENPEAAALLRAEGATAETQRAADVRAQTIPGHEALIERLAADGKTTGADAAKAVVAAERQARAAQATARTEDAPKAVPQAPVETDANAAPAASASKADLLTNPQALDKAARAYQAANPGTNYIAAVRAVQLEA